MTTQTIQRKRLRVGNAIIAAVTAPAPTTENVTVRTRTAIVVAPARDQYTHDRTWFVQGEIRKQVEKEDIIRWARTPSHAFETIPDHLKYEQWSWKRVKKFLWGLLP